MNDHPLGNIPTPDDTEQPQPAAATTTPDMGAAFSIVDNVLDLDAYLSGDVRRAEKNAAWYTRADLEADIEDLNAELDSLTDSQGRPLPVIDQSVGDGARSAFVVASELRALQATYAASRVVVRMRQVDEDEWVVFTEAHKKALDEGAPFPAAFYEDLIVRSAIAPKFTVAKVRAFRAKAGHPVFTELAGAAWAVNTQSGVSIPKSLLSSAVQRQQTQG